MLTGTQLNRILTALGGNVLNLPDDLYSTKLEAIIELLGASGGVIPRLDDLETELYKLELVSGYTVDENIAGLIVDWSDKSFTRIQGATGLTAGTAFDKWNMFGGRKRCNVADDGTINAWYGDDGYVEDGSNGQVMVYQPKVYYCRIPIKLEKADLGYHIRKEALLLSDTPKNGFKLHPAFYDTNGNEIDYVMFSAYEGSVYDTSASAYILNDAQTTDFSTDKICSIANAKPMSGLSQNLTRPNVEQLAQNRGANWHGDFIQLTSLSMLLMTVELGMYNHQTAIESGVTSITDNSSYNCSSLTGSTSSLGNATGAATTTTNEIGGVETEYSVAGKRSVSYRGMENPWGNIWKFTYGVNFYGNGSNGGGIPYICTDFNFAESKKDGNYESAGFYLSNVSNYVSAFGYGEEKFDWLFIPSECGQNGANSSLPVGDYTYVSSNLNGWRIALMGGGWAYGSNAGSFYWVASYGVGDRGRAIGGRSAYVPTKNSTSYTAAVAAWNTKMAA